MYNEISEEVLVAEDRIVKLDYSDIALLKEKAKRNQRKRIRICAHKDINDKLHEMIIVPSKDTYIRPHKHLNKSESQYIIEGSAQVVIFDEIGKITDIIQLGDYSSGNKFYYRISDPCYHTLHITSDFLVIHETTSGPFRREDNVLAPWAPDENDRESAKEFMKNLAQDIAKFFSRR